MTITKIDKVVKVRCDAQHLRNALLAVKPIAMKCPSVFTTYHGKALIKSTGDSKLLVIAKNNPEQMISVSIPAEYDDEVLFVVGIHEVVKFLHKEKTAEIEVMQNSITIKSDSSEMKLIDYVKQTDFIVNEHVFLDKIKMPDDFTSKLNYVLDYCAVEIARPVLCGISFITENNKLSLCAADGFRLCIADFNYDKQVGDVIVPDFICRVFCKLAQKSDVYMEMTYEKQSRRIVRFSFNNITIEDELTQGHFPKYRGLFPDFDSLSWEFSCNAIDFCYRLNQTIDTGSNILRIQKSNSDEKLLINTFCEGYYQYQCELNVSNNRNADHVAVNKKYLLTALKAFVNAKFTIKSPASPLMITGDVDNLTILLMPMYVQW